MFYRLLHQLAPWKGMPRRICARPATEDSGPLRNWSTATGCAAAPSVTCWWTGAGNSVPATSSPECLRGLYAPDSVKLEEGFTRDMRSIGHLGTGGLEVRIVSAAGVEKAAPLIRRAFEAA
ncbi:hypothetical protein C3K23_05040 [Streptomyces sp. 604F]|nr:hypothetical protein C3K23_05040 [Streptomyces sp. 604F]